MVIKDAVSVDGEPVLTCDAEATHASIAIEKLSNLLCRWKEISSMLITTYKEPYVVAAGLFIKFSYIIASFVCR